MNRVDVQATLRRARLRVTVALSALCVAAVVSLCALSLPFFPYDAMRIYSLTPSTTEACPLEVIPVDRDYEVFEGADLQRVTVYPYWRAVDVPGVKKGSILQPDGLEADYMEAEMRPGRRVERSSILRVAPVRPGVWRPGSMTVAHGSPFLFLPLTQNLTPEAERTVTVKSLKECREGA